MSRSPDIREALQRISKRFALALGQTMRHSDTYWWAPGQLPRPKGRHLAAGTEHWALCTQTSFELLLISRNVSSRRTHWQLNWFACVERVLIKMFSHDSIELLAGEAPDRTMSHLIIINVLSPQSMLQIFDQSSVVLPPVLRFVEWTNYPRWYIFIKLV